VEYIQGNAVTCFEQFLNAAQEPADPTTITFYVRDPAGAVTAYVFGVDPEVTHPPTAPTSARRSATTSSTWVPPRWSASGTTGPPVRGR
jgi:hypothetical protein